MTVDGALENIVLNTGIFKNEKHKETLSLPCYAFELNILEES